MLHFALFAICSRIKIVKVEIVLWMGALVFGIKQVNLTHMVLASLTVSLKRNMIYSLEVEHQLEML